MGARSVPKVAFLTLASLLLCADRSVPETAPNPVTRPYLSRGLPAVENTGEGELVDRQNPPSDGASNNPQTAAPGGTVSKPLTPFPLTLVFGAQSVGTTSPGRTVTLTNHLKTALAVSATSASGDFAITRNTCGANIGPGLKCFLEVTATPKVAGTRVGELSIANGSPETPLVIKLSGTGITTGLTIARQYHSATLLTNGKVLIAGGTVCTPFCSSLASAELYDPATGTFSATGSLGSPRDHHTATLLNNGMVLITGGQAGYSLTSAELYDPATGTFTATGKLNVARHQHTATLLGNGMVLIAGGFSRVGRNLPTFLASAELYNPATKTFTPTGSLNTARDEHTATLLKNGMVLIAGGGNQSPSYLASAELYDPATGTFAAAGMLAEARYLHSATLLKNGTVLFAGGAEPHGGSGAIASVELFNPETRTFAATGKLNTARYRPAATLLNNGMVLVAGGVDDTDTVTAAAELYDPLTGHFVATGNLNIVRTAHTMTLLGNGMALAVGGVEESSLATAELFSPATGAFAATR
jgi:hypothetical protein